MSIDWNQVKVCEDCGDEFLYDREICGPCNNVRKVRAYRFALETLANIVDESLLLDEDLADAWDDLRKAVVEARNVLL